MSVKMKGIYKSFKYITQIFVVKEREMEIGYPTDVKHVAHIGLDNPSISASASAPSWMSEFKTTSSIGDISERRDSSATAVTALTHWSTHSQEFDLSIGYQSASDLSRELEVPNVPKKSKRKKNISKTKPSSPKSKSSSSSLRSAKSKASCNTNGTSSCQL